MCLDLIINLSNSVTNRSEYSMKICLFRKRSNPFMLEQILLNKMIKCPDTRSPTLKKNTSIIHSLEDSLIFLQNIPDGYFNFDWKT